MLVKFCGVRLVMINKDDVISLLYLLVFHLKKMNICYANTKKNLIHLKISEFQRLNKPNEF